MVIYAIVNAHTGRRYIGRSVSHRLRWNQHRSKLRQGRHPSRQLQAAWIADGDSAFSMIVVETLDRGASKRVAAERELWHLRRTPNPYNQSKDTLTGPAPGTVKCSAERKEQMRVLHLGKPKTAEHRRRISEARRGKSFPHKGGYTLSKETTERMRQSHLGLKGTPESRAKQSAALKGRVFTQAWKDKIRAAKAGKPWSSKRREAHLAMTLAS